ncbi:thioredoxin TrxC [Photobacterium aphoticum]|uniref:Thioredoxin n=1 Tax=Photobacterium aphoticum TaxID=754436 RepID=A0A0J1GGW7_9GAMM|nr:thioredoxin TrxC [Photobacterium aphoticum]KLU98800.1 thioredoxin [Photobacterium aphoticum]PSU56787.1 thioredoxin TrxC [Photobacterium aphoticum]GHA65532.1 thiol reductase thioredoxin [Photobacterium aphoticum]
MTTMTTRCPHCKSMNRIPTERVNEVATCGACKDRLLDGMPIEGTTDNFLTLLQGDKPVVVDFWAPWCNPCVGFAPVFEDVAKERDGNVRFVKIDTEAQQALAAQYRIRSIPTIMVFKNGQLADTINGALPKSQFDQWLNQALTK